MGALVLAVAVAMAIPAAAGAALVPPRTSPTPSHAPVAFRTFSLGHDETARNVCSLAVAPGHVACDALRRTDPTALQDHPARGDAHPDSTLGDDGAYSPSYLQSAYNIASATAAHTGGAGQIVAVVDAYSDPNIVADLAYYRSYFGLPTCPTGTVSASNTSCVFEQVSETGTSSLPAANSSWAVEESIDVDMVSAICPKCQILLVEANSTAIADVGTGVNTAVSMGADVVSNSYGGAEYAGEPYDAEDYYQHPGVPIVASTGDNGYGVEFPAAAPDVVAVGGTTLTQTTNTGTRNATETAWSEAGAGCSIYDSKPSWQTDTGCSDRTVADVSADANPSTGVWMYDSYDSSGLAIYGGTSVAAPIIASIYALADNGTGATTYAPNWLYSNRSALTPITSGSDGSCGTYLCNAADSQNGYNGPTGLGTPGGSPNSLAAFTAPSGPSPTAPSAPALNSAAPGNGSVALAWSAPSSNGGDPITGYNVYEGTQSGLESGTPVNASPLTGTSDTVTGLSNNTTYFFMVKAVNAVGSSVASNELSATPYVPEPPSAPSLVSVAAGNATATLTWSAPASDGTSPLLGYDVFEGTSPGGESTTALNGNTPLTGTSTQITGLTNGTTYYFTVTAVNAVGQSAASNELSATPVKPTAPSSPTLTSATAGNGSVALAWSPPSSDGTGTFEGYNVFVGTSAGGESATPTNQSILTGTSDTVTGLTDNTTYYFTVQAVSTVGSSASSNEKSATPFAPAPPSAPSLLSATAGNTQVSLTWSAPTSNGTSPLEGYDVYVGTQSGHESATPVNGSLLTGTTYTVTGLTNGTTYYFTVEAVNAVGNSPASTELSAAPFKPAAPSSPTLTGVTAGNASAALSWTAPSSNGTSPLEGYDVYVGTAAGGESATPANGSLVTGTSYTVTGLTNGTTYYFTVEAVNAVGNSSASNERSTTPFDPATPSSPVLGSAAAGSGYVTLSWAAPTSNGTSPLEGYDVYVGTQSGHESATAANGSLLTGTTYTVTGLTNGITYYFTVEAVNAVGNSAPSNELSASPFVLSAPSSPALTTASAGDTTATLTWSAPSSNGSSPLEGYDVYVGTSAGGESATPANGSLVTGTSYTVTGLTNGTTYFFTVEAVNSVGSSSPSNELSTEPFLPTPPDSPSLSTATAANDSVTLTWSPPDSSGTSPLEGYDVFVGISAGDESATPANGALVTGTTFTVTGLTNGTTYYFTVVAVTDVGSSPPSNELSATPYLPIAPSAPSLAITALGDGTVTLGWSTPVSEGTSPLEGYDVYVGTSAGGESATPENASLITSTSTVVSGLEDGTTYFFTVEAVSAAGNSPASNEMSGTPFVPTAPSSPTLATATQGNASVTLHWSAPGYGGTSALEGYDVYVGTSAGGESATPANGALVIGTTFTVTGLTNGTTYYFTVQAVSAVGHSAPSNELSATPVKPAAPTSPTLVTATRGDAAVALSWNPPASSGSSPLMGYEVYLSTAADGASTTAANATVVTSTSYTVTGLTNGSTYYFTVRAENAVGLSAPSNELSATPLIPVAPDRPRDVTATPGNAKVTLHWTAPLSFGTSPLVGYNVYASTSSTSPTLTPTNKAPITATTDVLTGLVNGTTYYLSVTAVTADGSSLRTPQVAAKPATTPGTVTTLAATTSSTTVRLHWTAPASTGGSPITHYEVYRSTTAGAEAAYASVTCAASTCTFTNRSLSTTTTYYYEVAAVNAVGYGRRSAPVSVRG